MKEIFVAGFQTNSFVDWPEKIASVVFLGGCNFRCYYCHNHNILSTTSNAIPFSDVLGQIKEQIGFVDGVVITGGEPTLHPHLREIITTLRKLGLPVKLDTNGTDSDLLKELVEKKLVDYVAMDVKAPLARYPEIVGAPPPNEIPPFVKGVSQRDGGFSLDEIQESIEYLKKQKKVDYMFRTTLAPVLTEEDIAELGKLIKGAKCFQLQQFVPNEFSNAAKTVLLPYSITQAQRFEQELSKHVEKVLLRGF